MQLANLEGHTLVLMQKGAKSKHHSGRWQLANLEGHTLVLMQKGAQKCAPFRPMAAC